MGMIANWTMVIVGAWAIISPWVLQFSSISLAKWSSIIVGLIIVLVNAWTLFGNVDEDGVSVARPEEVESGKGRGEHHAS